MAMATISGGKCILAAISKSQTNPSIELDSAAVLLASVASAPRHSHWPFDPSCIYGVD